MAIQSDVCFSKSMFIYEFRQFFPLTSRTGQPSPVQGSSWQFHQYSPAGHQPQAAL